MATTTDPDLHAALATLESEYGLAPTVQCVEQRFHYPDSHHGVGA